MQFSLLSSRSGQVHRCVKSCNYFSSCRPRKACSRALSTVVTCGQQKNEGVYFEYVTAKPARTVKVPIDEHEFDWVNNAKQLAQKSEAARERKKLPPTPRNRPKTPKSPQKPKPGGKALQKQQQPQQQRPLQKQASVQNLFTSQPPSHTTALIRNPTSLASSKAQQQPSARQRIGVDEDEDEEDLTGFDEDEELFEDEEGPDGAAQQSAVEVRKSTTTGSVPADQEVVLMQRPQLTRKKT